MAVIAADLESRVTELCDEAFEAFCEDVSSMFGTDIQCARDHIGLEPVADLRKRFKKLTAVHLIEATGLLDDTFQLLFDQGGLFTLSGVIVMLPEAKILQQIKSGRGEDAENLTDAAREVGNLLVGSWDRVFREGSKEHEHFVKTSTYIGKLWEHLDEVALSADGEVLLVAYEMTVDSYPSFHCAALFPTSLLGDDAGAAAELAESEPAPSEPASAPEDEPAPKDESTPAAEPAEVTPPKPEVPVQKPEPAAPPAEPEVAEVPLTVGANEPRETAKPKGPAHRLVQDDVPVVEKATKPAAPPAATAGSGVALEDTIGILSDERAAALIDQVFEDHAIYPADTGIRDLLNIPARDIMTKDVVWCGPDDAVQDVISAMQQHNAGYVLVGRNGALEGLISNSNILAALSPYLRPTFAKWHRPEDDATLGIKIKWVMTRPVRTIKPDVSLAAAIENMRRYGGRCLPVMDGQAKILGIITVFDILLRVLEADGASSWQGSPPQGPPLMI